MSKTSKSQVTAALTLKVPQRVGWSVQRGDQSWIGSKFATLADCLLQEASGQSVTFFLSLIFELTETEGTIRSSSGMPPGDN